MSILLSFVNPLEFILRYTVISGMIVAILGTALCFMAKAITISKHGEEFSKSDKLYRTLILLGILLILIGIIVIALPINATLYKV